MNKSLLSQIETHVRLVLRLQRELETAASYQIANLSISHNIAVSQLRTLGINLPYLIDHAARKPYGHDTVKLA